MCIWAIGGYLYFKMEKELIIFTKSKLLYGLTVFFILVLSSIPIISKITNNYMQNIVISILFLSLILFTINDSNKLVLRNNTFSFLGKISYGIYMYHPMVMFLVFPFANKYFPASENLITYNLFVYFFIFGITFLISHFSYKYIESYFIKIKDNKYKSL